MAEPAKCHRLIVCMDTRLGGMEGGRRRRRGWRVWRGVEEVEEVEGGEVRWREVEGCGGVG